MCFPSFGEWTGVTGFEVEKLKHNWSLFFFFFLFYLTFLSLWTVDDHSPQLLISQYTCASIRKRANTQAAYTRAILPQFSWRLFWLHRNRPKDEGIFAAWFNLIRTLMQIVALICRCTSKILGQPNLCFSPWRYYYVIWVNLWITKRNREAGG